jgi:hypothetical protein
MQKGWANVLPEAGTASVGTLGAEPPGFLRKPVVALKIKMIVWVRKKGEAT